MPPGTGIYVQIISINRYVSESEQASTAIVSGKVDGIVTMDRNRFVTRSKIAS